jgi:DNA repair protein SbcC/Rad50
MSLFSRLAGKPQQADEDKPVDRGLPQQDAAANSASGGNELDHLSYGDELLALAANAAVPASQRAAQQRLAQLIDAGSIDLSRLNGAMNDKVALLSVAALARDPAHLQRAADAIADMDFFLKLAIDGPSTRLRQLAAEKIEDPERLKKLLRHARGKDKNVFKIIKRKCDALNAEQRKAEEAEVHIVALGEAIERHSYKPFDGAYIATVEHFSTQWNAVAAQAPAELQARVKLAIERSREAIATHLRVIAAHAAQVSAIENADTQRQNVLDEMRKLLTSLYAADSLDAQANSAHTAQVAKWTERWKEASRYKPAIPADAATFDALRPALPQLLRLISRHGTLRQQLAVVHAAPPEQDLAANYKALRETLSVRTALGAEADLPEEVQAAVAALQEHEKSRADRQATAAKALHKVGGLIHKATRALADGQSAQAAGMRRSIGQMMADLPSVPAHLTAQLEQLDRRLGELQDWKSFAVTPKRAQLIERMEALIGFDTHPNELANRIRKLQEEWKTISKGGAAQSESDWEKFHRAAQAAYEPCREYFAAQAQVRQENLEKRKRIAAALADFEATTDWANVDWREVAKLLRDARQDWRNFNPTERAATKPVQEQFDALIDKLQGRLDAEYAGNIERKRTLIQQAQRLVEDSDTRRAIDEIKRLQSVWKNVGLVPHIEDQRLWEEFRQHCDAVFQKSQQAYSQAAAEAEGHKAKALAICAEVEQLANASGAAIFEGAARLRQLREEFAAIGDLPRGDANALRKKFERAVEQFERAVGQQRSRDEEQRWDNLFAASNEVRLLQLATLDSSDADTDPVVQALRESTGALVAADKQWPKGGAPAIKEKLAATVSPDVNAHETALRTLCIRAEIITDTPTPAEDQALRRNYQLQSLVKGFGQSVTPGRQQVDAMVFEWIAVGPIPTPVYASLFERFRQCWKKAQRLPA